MQQYQSPLPEPREVESLLPTADELVSVIESGLHAHGSGETVLPPKAHLVLDHLVNGHFNILSGYVGPIGWPA